MTETLIGIEVMNDINTTSQSSELIVVLPPLTDTDVVIMKVPESKLSLRARELSIKGLEKDLSTRLVVAVQENVRILSKSEIVNMARTLKYN